jgi:hypothetical protein
LLLSHTVDVIELQYDTIFQPVWKNINIVQKALDLTTPAKKGKMRVIYGI